MANTSATQNMFQRYDDLNSCRKRSCSSKEYDVALKDITDNFQKKFFALSMKSKDWLKRVEALNRERETVMKEDASIRKHYECLSAKCMTTFKNLLQATIELNESHLVDLRAKKPQTDQVKEDIRKTRSILKFHRTLLKKNKPSGTQIFDMMSMKSL